MTNEIVSPAPLRKGLMPSQRKPIVSVPTEKCIVIPLGGIPTYPFDPTFVITRNGDVEYLVFVLKGHTLLHEMLISEELGFEMGFPTPGLDGYEIEQRSRKTYDAEELISKMVYWQSVVGSDDDRGRVFLYASRTPEGKPMRKFSGPIKDAVSDLCGFLDGRQGEDLFVGGSFVARPVADAKGLDLKANLVTGSGFHVFFYDIHDDTEERIMPPHRQMYVDMCEEQMWFGTSGDHKINLRSGYVHLDDELMTHAYSDRRRRKRRAS